MRDEATCDLRGMDVAAGARMTAKVIAIMRRRPHHPEGLSDMAIPKRGDAAEPEPFDAPVRLVRGRRALVSVIGSDSGPATLRTAEGGKRATVDVGRCRTYLERGGADRSSLETDVEGTEAEVLGARRRGTSAPMSDAIPVETERADGRPPDPSRANTARGFGSRFEVEGHASFAGASGAAAPAVIRAE